MKRTFTSTISLLLCLVMLLGVVFTGCDEGKNTDTPSDQTGNVTDTNPDTDDTTIPCDGVSISSSSVSLTAGESVMLTANVTPENATDKNVTWTSSNDAIAFVVNGSVTAIGKGVAVIIATTTNGKTATCTVIVTNDFVAVNGVSLNKSSITITEGNSTTLTATVSPANASDRNVTWTSSNASVASVSNGKVTALGAGSATITATTSNGKTATCNVTVNAAIAATGISLNKTSLSLMEGEGATLSATVSPSNATNKSVTWKSSNTKVATVSEGKVTALGAGSATITVTTSNGKTATCTVTVTAVIRATSVSLDKTRLDFSIGDSYTLTATVSPADTTDKSVSWKSSNTNVATVSKGKVTALGAGGATITVTTTNGKTATCTVTVTGDPLDDFYYNANTTGYTITGVKNKNKTSYVVPNNVTIINAGVFAGCNNMESITLPGDISSAFGAIFGTLYDPKATATTQNGKTYYIPSTLTSVTLTASIRSSTIGKTLFSGYGSSVSVNVIFNDSVTSIGDWAFDSCSGITSITIPNSVTSIGESAFSYCSGLTSITVKSGNTKYHSDGNCLIETATKTLVLGCKNSVIPTDGSVTSIGERAFYGCRGLTSITIPNSVTSIGYEAFFFCSGLTSITIPNSVTSIGSHAFHYCIALTSITIPNSVTSIGTYAFQYCDSLTSITIPFVGATKDGTENTHFGYIFGASSSSDHSMYVPSTLKTVKITGGTSIESHAFRGCSSLTSITIGNSVTSIGDDAFYNCSDLTSVTIGNSVTSIGDDAFYNCSGLTSVTIPDSVKSIGSYAFYGCSGLTSITIPFVGATKNGTSDMHFGHIFGAETYSDNSSSVPSTLKTVIITGGTSIESYAFYNCSGLTSITIGNSVTSIGTCAFRYCSGLTSVTIPDSVTSIGKYAFDDCSGLTSITVKSGNTKYHSDGNCLIETTTKTLVLGCKNSVIPTDGSVTSIGSSAFSGCSGLTSITIPNSVTSIGSCAFYGCSGLTSVTIGNGVTSIGSSAFSGCSGLTSINFNGTKAQWEKIALGSYWRDSSGITKIVCTDGTITLN